jgi:hypothetical protein
MRMAAVAILAARWSCRETWLDGSRVERLRGKERELMGARESSKEEEDRGESDDSEPRA